MILQALHTYYQRKRNLLPLHLVEQKNVLEVVLNEQAEIVNLTYDKENEYTVPLRVKKSNNILPNLLCDNPTYVLGVNDDKKNVDEKHKAFIEKQKEFAACIENEKRKECLDIVLRFLKNSPLEAVKNAPSFKEEYEKAGNVTFRIGGELISDIIFKEPLEEGIKDFVFDFVSAEDNSDGAQMICLLTGESCDPTRLHKSIKNVSGANTSGANIVSFNEDVFCSYGQEQGRNAPVSREATLSYVSALSDLLRKGSDLKYKVGDTTTVFWLKEADDDAEKFATALFGVKDVKEEKERSQKEDTPPDKYTEVVKALLESINSGKFSRDEGKNSYHLLGLSPNAARISIRFWFTGTVEDLSKKYQQYFEELKIVVPPYANEYKPLNLLLKSIAVQEDWKNIPPKMGGEMMRSILTGTPYPYTVLSAAVARCKNPEANVNHTRASLIKAWLNRNKNEDLKMSLDKENNNTAYCLGRAFAVLEKIQKDANPGIGSTITDRYYSKASSHPATVFPVLDKLAKYHLGKLETGFKIHYEKLLCEIFYKIGGKECIPKTLSLENQGRFMIGYYHQLQDLYTKKSNEEKLNNEGE